MESFVQSQPGNDIILYNHQQQKYFHLLKPMQCKLLLRSLLALYFLIAITNLQVFNLTILVRQYFSGLYFRNFNSQIWKRALNFVILHSQLHFGFQTVWTYWKFLDGTRNVWNLRKLTLFYNWRFKMKRSSKTS